MRAGAADGPICSRSAEGRGGRFSSKWKKGGWCVPFLGKGQERHAAAVGLSPGCWPPPGQGPPSKAGGDSGSDQSTLCCRYPPSGYFKGAATWK